MHFLNCLHAVYLLQIMVLMSSVTFAALTNNGESFKSMPNAFGGPSDQIITKQYHTALPYCSDKLDHTIGRRLLYVSTLDGHVSALDINNNGKLRWSILTSPGPLISSSIHRLELTSNGHFVRMIPSLSGGIYKFDGESIDPIPISAENLLSSSAKFSDDLVISGGKETRTYGVSARTGQILYECSMDGCVNISQNTTTNAAVMNSDDVDNSKKEDEIFQEKIIYPLNHDPQLDDVIVVRRQTQTVRAIESRTGIERWNFSVGHHELDLIQPIECHEDYRKSEKLNFMNMDNIDVKVIVPDGIICAFNKTKPNSMLWKYKFDHPIVSAWKYTTDDLVSIDLFASAQWTNLNNGENIPLTFNNNPAIYLGMYKKQLYIQESLKLRKEIVKLSNTSENLQLPKIPWRPIFAGKNNIIALQDYNTDKNMLISDVNNVDSSNVRNNELVPYDVDNFALSAQSVLNASEYVNGSGFYLYVEKEAEPLEENAIYQSAALESQENSENFTPHNSAANNEYSFDLNDIEVPAKIVIMSLWWWWKEVLAIAISSAALLNFFLIKHNRQEREILVIERHIPVPTRIDGLSTEQLEQAAILGPTTSSGIHTKSSGMNEKRSISESTSNSSGDQFSSRFQTDFEMLRCLGRGGFGVVFEAKNKLDDCHYAIKRITLPSKEESRKRVMREVKTLANCEHQNIVRYFQSWVEKPPPGWQEEEDRKWLSSEMSTSIQVETPTPETHQPYCECIPPNNFEKIDLGKQVNLWMENVVSSTSSSTSQSHNKQINNEEDDSFIEFRSESGIECEDIDVQRFKKSYTNASVDIDSHFLNNPPYSKLSRSFQIESVRSSNNHTMKILQDKETEENDIARKSARQHLSLDISDNIWNINNQEDPVAKLLYNNNNNKVYLYIQMQLCRKESLRHWLRDNTTEQRSEYIASIFHQIVDAVDYVHVKGLIHRDLKPSNIFFSQDGQIKIGDFGLVKDVADNLSMHSGSGDHKTIISHNARHTQQVGTHLYMSPEQLRGLPYDFKVDIYSLGVIFFELLVYFSTEMERISTLRSLRDGIYPQEFPHDYPKEHELLVKMLSENPNERPSTQDLKLQLTDILKLTDLCVGDSEAAALAAAARRLSRSRTFSSCD